LTKSKKYGIIWLEKSSVKRVKVKKKKKKKKGKKKGGGRAMERVMNEVERVSFLGDVEKRGIFILNEDFESVKAGAELLKDYFWVVVGHGTSDYNKLFRRDAASFYTYKIPSIEELEGRGFLVEQVNFSLTIRDKIFFDVRSVSFPIELYKPQKVFYIKVNGRVAGVYFCQDRVLVASDWTHNASCIIMLKELLPELSKILKKKGKRSPRIISKISFGADPEFELVDRRTRCIVPASEVIVGGTSVNDKIGIDGSGSQVELRPDPSRSINKFILNVKNVLKEFANSYPYYSLSVLGDRYPLGGHIHLSIPAYDWVLRLLDNWVGSRVIDLSGEARGSYKRLGAYEMKPWGFEYRTPPAAIFLKPDVLKAVLTIMKRVLTAYFNGGVALYPVEEEVKRLGIERDWEVLNKFVSEYKELDKDVLKQWKILVRVKPRLELSFSDDWRGDVRDFVRDLFFKKISKRLVKKLNSKGIYRVVFFGFRKERGEVCNFDSLVFRKIDFSYSVSGGVAFGFPWVVRMPIEFGEELKEKWERVMDEVVVELKKKVS
jgi:hypothetical protein